MSKRTISFAGYMDIDIIEVRVGNYFAVNGQVREITLNDLQQLDTLLPQLKPIPITPIRLNRLNFVPERGQHGIVYHKLAYKVLFTFIRMKNDKVSLVINETVRLPHIQYIHQLQNVYYDLTGDVLKRPD